MGFGGLNKKNTKTNLSESCLSQQLCVPKGGENVKKKRYRYLEAPPVH
jgi:hypothetical protein